MSLSSTVYILFLFKLEVVDFDFIESFSSLSLTRYYLEVVVESYIQRLLLLMFLLDLEFVIVVVDDDFAVKSFNSSLLLITLGFC